MNDYGIVMQPDTIRFERLLPGPIELVWAFLTESEKRALWLAGGEMDLRAGGHVELRFKHAELSDRPGEPPQKYKQYTDEQILRGTITRCEAPRVLAYTWGDSATNASEVTFELSEKGRQVMLVITHRRLHDRAELTSIAGGWHTHLEILADRLEHREPENFWVTHTKVEQEYERRLPRA